MSLRLVDERHFGGDYAAKPVFWSIWEGDREVVWGWAHCMVGGGHRGMVGWNVGVRGAGQIFFFFECGAKKKFVARNRLLRDQSCVSCVLLCNSCVTLV